MFVKTKTGTLHGVDAHPVEVEVDALRSGMPGWNLVGLPSASVSEGKIRVRAAILNSGFKLDARRVTVNLAPAEMRKDTTAFDLPIALAVLGAYELVPEEALQGVLAVGELALDGALRRVNGVISVADLARRQGVRELLVPSACAAEAAVVEGITVRAADHLLDVVQHLMGAEPLPEARPAAAPTEPARAPTVDLADVRGQAVPRRALEIAAAGGHNLLMVGPPGAGKSMLARRLPTILPPLSFEESLEVTRIYSVAGLLHDAGLIRERPFRAPHHSVSMAGLVGGGAYPRPGELSLAHLGVLFLDELLEFRRETLEALRQPLEDRRITLTRARTTVTFPSSIQLVAAMNPCPCGHRDDPRRSCVCSDGAVDRYWGRLSGPLIDRIDLLIEVPALSFEELTAPAPEESSAAVRARVTGAVKRQLRRIDNHGLSNAQLHGDRLGSHDLKDTESRRLLEVAVERLGLSARAVHRVLRVARTIADLAGDRDVGSPHVAEALAYRQLER